MEIKTNAKIRVRLESFNHELLMSSCRKIIDLVQSHDINKFSLVSLPTDKRIYCVLRSPHVNKKSQEQFEYFVCPFLVLIIKECLNFSTTKLRFWDDVFSENVQNSIKVHYLQQKM